MSTVKTNNVQIGQSATATNNFTWYQPASPDGTVRLGNGNAGSVTDAVTVTSAGNVGIGTSAPDAKFSVSNATRFSGSGDIWGKADNTGYTAIFGGGTFQGGAGISCFASSNTIWPNAIIFTNGSYVERMRIDSAGNVGIGTSSPSTYGKLAVFGSIGIPVAGTSAVADRSITFNIDGTNYARIYAPNGKSLAFQAGSGTLTDAVTIDQSGNVGIGTSSPSQKFEIAGGAAMLGNNWGHLWKNAAGTFTYGTAGANIVFDTSNNLIYDNYSTGVHIWRGTNYAERMRLSAAGNLLVGTTADFAKVVGYSQTTAHYAMWAASNYAGDATYAALRIDKYDNNTTTSQVFINFSVNNNTVASGQINANGTAQAAFGSWSDRRLKENITDLPPQLANICALRPCEFDYVASEGGGHQIGFIAQEMDEVYPDAVGERSDGMLTLTGWGKTEARLVKAIQEQQAIIEDLRARLAALEAK